MKISNEQYEQYKRISKISRVGKLHKDYVFCKGARFSFSDRADLFQQIQIQSFPRTKGKRVSEKHSRNTDRYNLIAFSGTSAVKKRSTCLEY